MILSVNVLVAKLILQQISRFSIPVIKLLLDPTGRVGAELQAKAPILIRGLDTKNPPPPLPAPEISACSRSDATGFCLNLESRAKELRTGEITLTLPGMC